MDFTIRPAETHDRPAMLAIYNYEIINGVALFDIRPKSPQDWEKWCRAHSVGNHLLLVAASAAAPGGVAGFAGLGSYRDKDAYAATVELSIFVEKSCRRQGVGRALMEAAVAAARARDDVHTIVSVITGSNQASRALHEACGFRCCGTIKEAGFKAGQLLDIVHYQLMV